jgi:hypothetical protein
VSFGNVLIASSQPGLERAQLRVFILTEGRFSPL